MLHRVIMKAKSRSLREGESECLSNIQNASRTSRMLSNIQNASRTNKMPLEQKKAPRSDGQVHPTARSLPHVRSNLNTIPFSAHPKVPSCSVLGKNTASDQPSPLLRSSALHHPAERSLTDNPPQSRKPCLLRADRAGFSLLPAILEINSRIYPPQKDQVR